MERGHMTPKTRVYMQTPLAAADGELHGEGRRSKLAGRPDDGIVVFAGATGRLTWMAKRPGHERRRAELIADGKMEVRGDTVVLLVDVKFSSPSEAAIVLSGSNMNGLDNWRRRDSGLTLSDHAKQADADGAVDRLSIALKHAIESDSSHVNVSTVDLAELLHQATARRA